MSIKEGISFFSSGWVSAGNFSSFSSLNAARSTSLSKKLMIISRILGTNSYKTKMYFTAANLVLEWCELYITLNTAINGTEFRLLRASTVMFSLWWFLRSDTIYFYPSFWHTEHFYWKLQAHTELWHVSQVFFGGGNPQHLPNMINLKPHLCKNENDLNKEKLSSEFGLINWGSGLQTHRPWTQWKWSNDCAMAPRGQIWESKQISFLKRQHYFPLNTCIH